MSDLSKPERFNAYWFSLEATGVEAIDDILREIAAAGKGSHSTEFWGGQEDTELVDESNYIERIQNAANDAARRFASLTSPETIEKVEVKREHWLTEQWGYSEAHYSFSPRAYSNCASLGNNKEAGWPKCNEQCRDVVVIRGDVEAVLRSVEEGTQ